MLKTMDVAQVALACQQRFKKTEAEFFRLFNVKLKDFWDVKSREGLVCGFDVIAFDKVVKPPPNCSTMDMLRKKFGVKAAAWMVEQLEFERELWGV